MRSWPSLSRTAARCGGGYGLVAPRPDGHLADLQGRAERARDAARDRYEAGGIPRLELLQAELNLSQATNEAAAVVGERDASRAELNALIGRNPVAPTEPLEDLGQAALPTADIAATAALAATRSWPSSTTRWRRQRRAPPWPAGADPGPQRGGRRPISPPASSTGAALRGGITLPLFTRHRAAVQVEATVAQLKAARGPVQRPQAAVSAALARATVQREQYLRRNEIPPRSREVETMAEESYRAGQTGLVALLQALQAAKESRAKAVQAAVDYQVALAELERAAAVGPP
jgi:outer membrane protein TolC